MFHSIEFPDSGEVATLMQLSETLLFDDGNGQIARANPM
jgi:hypothetical protein